MSSEVAPSSDPNKESTSVPEYPLATSSVNKYDPYSLKSSLDEELIAFLEEKNFKEITHWTDLKIGILLLVCLAAYYSHFVAKFPQDWPLVVGCSLAYIILMTIHYLNECRIEKDEIFSSKSHVVSTLIFLFKSDP